MGKGDKKSKRGKINRGTYGKRRPRKKSGFTLTISSKEDKNITEKKPVEDKPESKTEKKKTIRRKAAKKDSEKKKPAEEG